VVSSFRNAFGFLFRKDMVHVRFSHHFRILLLASDIRQWFGFKSGFFILHRWNAFGTLCEMMIINGH
jgi:hypothetical protein